MIVAVQIFHKIGFFQDWLPHPPLVVWNNLYKGHTGFIYNFNLLPLSYNVSAYKDQNQNWCVIGYVDVQKMSFHIFLAILGQIPSFLLPWQRAINCENRASIAY